MIAALLLLFAAADPAADVNPFIGTGNLGHNFPGATVPFGMVQASPDTRLKGWGSCAGYVYDDKVIFGFSQTHLSGTGIPDYGDILLLPATGAVKWKNGYLGTSEEAPGFDPRGYGSRYDKASESASPGSYSVTLSDSGVRVDLTATTRVAFHRYLFQRANNAHVLLDLTHHDEVLESWVQVVDDHTVTGMRRSKAWAKNQPVYFVATFDKPFVAAVGAGGTRGLDVKVALKFRLAPGETVLAKVALSAVDVAGAQKNLAAELPGWDFEATRAAARAAWNRELSKITIEGGSKDDRVVFTTALYHALLQPNTFQDVDGRYLGRDLKPHTAAGWTQHTVFSLWDTYRAAHPLYTLIEPEKDLDFVQTLLAEYRDGGRLPVWELWANETNTMIGYHAVPVIVDAWMKGIRGFDPQLALRAMKHSAEEHTPGLDAYRAEGYIPADKEPESVSKTLEYAYDDWAIARFARAIGATEDARVYERRAQAWQHLLDGQGFFHPRANGMWLEPFNLNAVTFHYTEATPWQYEFAVPQDLDGFIARLGGRQKLDEKLDGLFAASSRMEGWEEEDVTGLVGQYAHGNEPSHHIAYLYDWAGKPWKTQALVRRLMREMYANRPDGLAGNEDCGQMSAWYVFGALGFYPVAPGKPEYAIGSPLFPRATLRLENGRQFVVRTTGTGPYVQSATLNGADFHQLLLTQDQIRAGGELVFAMGEKASTWGEMPAAALTSEAVLPAPAAAGEAVFQGKTTVALSGTGELKYALDGGEPSTPYTGPLELDHSATLRFQATRGALKSPIVETRLQRLPDFPKLKLESHIHPTFRASGPLALIDGVRGTKNFRAGNWQGFAGEDLRATLDLGEARPVHRAAISFLQDPYTWTYFPLEVRFETSADGQRWTAAPAIVTPEALRRYGPHLHDGKTEVHDYVVPLGVRARYVRVVARSPLTIPKGSWREGKTAFICADELRVE